MNTKELTMWVGKCAFLVYILINLPLAGIALIAYLIHTEDKIRILKRQLDAALEEDKEQEILTKGLENVDVVNGNLSTFNIHEECIIENYQNKFFRVMKPSGEYLPKIFLSEADAKREVDMVTSLLPKTKEVFKRRRSRIYNIRFVK